LLEQTEGTRKAMDVMQEANHIFQDFPVSKYAIYTLFFLVQVALCFYIGLKM
jgi:hypothetical protein